MAILHAKNISTGYGAKALHHFDDLTLPMGELVCMLGSNGAGKSTLLRVLSGLQPPLDGDVFLDGKSIKKLNRKFLAKHISVVLTEKIQVSEMSVFDLIATGRYPYTNLLGNLGKEDVEIIEEAAEQCGVHAFLGNKIDSLSDGERQKAMIAKSLAQQSPILFLDEPAAFLDYPSKLELMLLLREISNEQNKSILMSTHDVEPAIESADQLWLLGKDKSFEAGTPEDLVLSGSLARFFENKQVDFDPQRGSFRIQPVRKKAVCLKAEDSLKKYWLLKALQRKGFYHDAAAEWQIEIANEGYLLKRSGRIETLADIGSLLGRLDEKL